MPKKTELKDCKPCVEEYLKCLNYNEVSRRLNLHRDVCNRRIATYLKEAKDGAKWKDKIDKATVKAINLELNNKKAAEPEDIAIPNARVVRRSNPKGRAIKRYILSSQQLSTPVEEGVMSNLEALAKHYDAEILISRFSYNKNAYGKMSVKVGKAEKLDHFWDKRTEHYWCDDDLYLGKALIFAGGLNITPTASNPLTRLKTHYGRASLVVPHPRIAFDSVASIDYTESPKFLMTTGSVTAPNYIGKLSGDVAKAYHTLGAIIVEVNSNGEWFARQITKSPKDGTIYDLDIMVKDGQIVKHEGVLALQFGDLHTQTIPSDTKIMMYDMCRELKPEYIVAHDSLSWGNSASHHKAKNDLARYKDFHNHNDCAETELKQWAKFLSLLGDFCKTLYVPCSNHDQAVDKWLDFGDYRQETKNRCLFLECQLRRSQAVRDGEKDFYTAEWLYHKYGDKSEGEVVFGREKGERASHIIGKVFDGIGIEIGSHSHNGVSGSRGSIGQFAKLGRPVNIGHGHSATIDGHAYMAGTMSMNQGYNKGLHKWSVANILTHRNNERQMIVCYRDNWRM